MTEQQTKMLGLLNAGISPREVSDQLNIKYSTVATFKRKLAAEAEEAQISKMAMAQVETLLDIKEDMTDTALTGQIDTIIDGVVGVKQLEPEFHRVMMTAIGKADDFLKVKDLELKDWKMILTTISEAYAAIFNKSGTVVNVANTQVSAGGEAAAFFKASKKS